VLKGPTSVRGVRCLAFSPDGNYLVAGAGNPATGPAVWDVKARRRVPAARGPDCQVRAFGFRDGRIIALGIDGRALVVFDVLGGKRFDDGEGHRFAVNAVAFRKKSVYTACAEGRVIEWGLDGKRIATKPPPRGDANKFLEQRRGDDK